MSQELELDQLPKKPNLNNRKLVWTKRGLTIIKNEFSNSQILKIKNDLLVKPYVCKDYGLEAKPFRIYLESNKKLYIPKFYGLNNIGKEIEDKLYNGKDIDINFIGNLRDKQKIVVNKYLETCDLLKPIDFNKSQGGIISVGCGFGKTVLALYIISIIKKKTLVIVHKEFLVNQWKERINQYLPNSKIGVIQGKKIEIEDCDIVIGMLQSISMKDYDDDIFKDFGLCIIDECHHIGAEVFSRSLTKINCRYMLGLSATPKRKDGLSKVFEWYIGPYVFKDTNKDIKKAEAKLIYYNNYDPLYSNEETNCFGKICIPKMITNISLFMRRNKLVCDLILQICENYNRQVLILGDRREQLKILEKMLNQLNFTNIGYYVGGMKEKDLKTTETKQVILATYSMSSEGMDIPSLNTLILISSKSDIEQSVGRILRKDHSDNIPTIYDIVDNFSIFSNQSKKRLTFYNKNKYLISTSNVIDNGKITNLEIMKLVNNFTYLKKKKKNEINTGKCLL